MLFQYYDFGWTLICCSLMVFKLVGIILVHGGLGENKDQLHITNLTLLFFMLGLIQWWISGFALGLDNQGYLLIGTFHTAFFRNIGGDPYSSLMLQTPKLLVAIGSMFQAGISSSILAGAFSGRGKFYPALLVCLLWNLFVLTPVIYWCYGPLSWAVKMGAISFCGGGANIAIGTSALVIQFFLGPRKRNSQSKPTKLQIFVIMFGTMSIWLGWFGIIGTTTYSSKYRSVICFINITFSGIFGGLGNLLLSYFTKSNKTKSFSLGAISGFLICAPILAYRDFFILSIVSFFGSILITLFTWLIKKTIIDDSLELFSYHTITSLIGMLLTGLISTTDIAHLEAERKIQKSLIEGNWIQPFKQLALSFSVFGWSLVVTFLIMFILSRFINFRVDEEIELMGLDYPLLGEIKLSEKDQELGKKFLGMVGEVDTEIMDD